MVYFGARNLKTWRALLKFRTGDQNQEIVHDIVKRNCQLEDVDINVKINQMFERRGRFVPLLEEAPGAPDGK